MKKGSNRDKIFTVLLINCFIFFTVNILFNIKYEQVDDFIMYSLYSGLDGTSSIYAVYMHPFLCMFIGIFYKILPLINWHTIFLLSMQFLCFTLIGYTILKKHYTGISIILYTLAASIFYTILLLLIQYTSVAALLIMTAFLLTIDIIEHGQDIKNRKAKLFGIFTLFAIGVMLRFQSLLIIAPFYAIYLIIYFVKYKRKIIDKEKIYKLIKYYFITLIVAVVVYVSNFIIYSTNPVYKEYNEWNNYRTSMQDIARIYYDKDKNIYDSVGWSQNDYILFYTFGFGDENVFSKEHLKQIVETKKEVGNYDSINKDFLSVANNMDSNLMGANTVIFIIFLAVYILNIFKRSKVKENTLIFITVLLTNAIFIILNRNFLRVMIPEYILGTILLIYNLNYKSEKINDGVINSFMIILIIITTCKICGNHYNYNYKLKEYNTYRKVIEYTNNNKDNVYLYTIPSLQDRYLAYSVYEMPPKESFSNLKQIGRLGYVYTKLL